MSTVEFDIHFSNGPKGRKRMRSGPKPAPHMAKTRIPRVARLMALAIHFDELIRLGLVVDYADLARLGGVSRARISQIMDLLNLAPDIQEVILDLSSEHAIQYDCSVKKLNRLSRESDWAGQRQGAQLLLLNSEGGRNGEAQDSPSRSEFMDAGNTRYRERGIWRQLDPGSRGLG